MAHYLGSAPRSIMSPLADAPAGPGSDVFDLRAVARTMQAHHQPAVHQLVRRGVLEWMTPTASGFRPDDGWESRVRFVRCGAGS